MSLPVQELSTLHDRHLNRPTLDDSVDEEQTIEITTKEITQVCRFWSLLSKDMRLGMRHVSQLVMFVCVVIE